ncbi:hypothetical protein BGZ94_007838 [Podila epigama]|nr:hypothetical protein BGZ94_007838 [Podila epigama]
MVQDSDNIVKFYGITRMKHSGDYGMVLQFAGRGSLRDYLAQHFKSLDWTQKVSLAHDVAAGVNFIHQDNICHHDLHSRNVLIDNNCRALITDFGLSRYVNNANSNNGVRGVVPYISPERLKNAPFDHSSDVYSLGVIMWELTSGHPPFNREGDNFLLPFDIMRGRREEIVPGTPVEYSDLYKQCWDGDPKQRPHLSLVLRVLETMLETQSSTGGERGDPAPPPVVQDSHRSMPTVSVAVVTPPADPIGNSEPITSSMPLVSVNKADGEVVQARGIPVSANSNTVVNLVGKGGSTLLTGAPAAASVKPLSPRHHNSKVVTPIQTQISHDQTEDLTERLSGCNLRENKNENLPRQGHVHVPTTVAKPSWIHPDPNHLHTRATVPPRSTSPHPSTQQPQSLIARPSYNNGISREHSWNNLNQTNATLTQSPNDINHNNNFYNGTNISNNGGSNGYNNGYSNGYNNDPPRLLAEMGSPEVRLAEMGSPNVQHQGLYPPHLPQYQQQQQQLYQQQYIQKQMYLQQQQQLHQQPHPLCPYPPMPLPENHIVSPVGAKSPTMNNNNLNNINNNNSNVNNIHNSNHYRESSSTSMKSPTTFNGSGSTSNGGVHRERAVSSTSSTVSRNNSNGSRGGHWMPQNGRTNIKDFFSACRSGNLEAVKWHLAQGADVMAPYETMSNRTALHAAAMSDSCEVMEVMCESAGNRLNMNELDDSSQTPLHLLTQYGRNPNELLVYMLRMGANPNALDSERRTPLMTSFILNDNPQLVETLLDYGADPNLKCQDNNALAEAAIRLRYQCVKVLLETDLSMSEGVSLEHAMDVCYRVTESPNRNQVLSLLVRWKNTEGTQKRRTLARMIITGALDQGERRIDQKRLARHVLSLNYGNM